MIYRDVWTKRLDFLGQNHQDTILSENNMANTLSEMGRISEAREHLENALATARRCPDLEITARLRLMFNLADLLIREKNYLEAKRLAYEVLTQRRDHYGIGHPRVINSTTQLFRALVGLKDYSEADQLMKEGSRIAQKTLSSKNGDRISLHLIYGDFLATRNRHSEAVEEYVYSYEGLSALDRPEAGHVLDKIVTLCTRSGQTEKAKKYRALRSPPGN